MELAGIEPATPCLQSRCSSQLSYSPENGHDTAGGPRRAAEILRDHWYIVLVMLGIVLGSRLAGVPTWLGTVVGVAIYAAVVRGWRWWRRRQGPTEDPRAELDGEGGTG